MDRTVLALAVACLRGQKEYDDCNPDVGFGPSLATLLDRVENAAGIKFTKEERVKILLDYQDKYGSK